ncbi:MAG: recombination-associated protein RdgC [Desulfonauticus sp.]|nr:recombination-associated protein RdgC [Desulfonauticus sp.]
MGILSASVSFTLYKVEVQVSDELFKNIQERLRLYGFKEIEELSVERGAGWVCFDNWLDSSFFTSPFKGQYAVFSLRLDTRRIAPAVLKKHYEVALKELLQKKQEQGQKFVAREEKKELKENIRLKLLTKTLPVPAVFDVVWDMEKNFIYFCSVREKVQELFVDLFVRTFELQPILLTPVNFMLKELGFQEDDLKDYKPQVLVR